MQEVDRYLGHYGLFQWYMWFLNFIPEIVSCGQILAFTWTGFAPNARCYIASLDGNMTNYETPFNNTNRWFAPPKEKGQYCDYCPQANISHCTSSISEPCKSGHVFDRDTALIPDTLAIEFDLACDTEWKRRLVFSLPTVGLMIGLTIISPLSDRFGRRPILLTSAALTIIITFLIPLANNYTIYALLEVLAGATSTGVSTTAYILFMEMVSEPAKTLGGIWIQGQFTIGILFICLIAKVLPHWKYIHLVIACPSILFIAYYWICPESTRWLIIHGKTEEAEKAIKKAAKLNGVHIPSAVIRREIAETRLSHNIDNKKRATVVDLFKQGSLAKITLIVFYNCFNSKTNSTICFMLAVSMGYYGLAQNTEDLPGNPYMTNALSAISELPGLIICVPIMERFGRKPALIILFGIGGISCILAGLVPNTIAVVVLAMVGKMSIAGAFAVVYNYSAEVFPTVVRQSGFGYASVCARLGSIAAPQIRLLGDYVGEWVPIVIYGCVALLAGFLDFFLPETLNKPLPESIDDAVHFTQPEYQRQKSNDTIKELWTSSESSSNKTEINFSCNS